MSADSLHREQAAAIECYLSKNGGVTEVQVWVWAQRHLTGADPTRAASILLSAHRIGWRSDVPARIAILLEEFSSDQLVKLLFYS